MMCWRLLWFDGGDVRNCVETKTEKDVAGRGGAQVGASCVMPENVDVEKVDEISLARGCEHRDTALS